MIKAKDVAIYEFWASFGIPAYEQNSVPKGDNAQGFPFLTYSVTIDSEWEQVALDASLWYRGTSWADCETMLENISRAFNDKRRCILECDGGAIVLRKGTPFANNMSDPEDNLIKRKVLNVEAMYVTTF